MTDHIVIIERWTRKEGWRKVGNGSWEPIDLAAYGGRVPVVFLNDKIDWTETTMWEKPEMMLPK
jgi:hypothetical protein